MSKETIIVSACLLGLKTRYDGTDALSHKALLLLEGCNIVPVCPEQLGGLPTPRPRAVIEAGSGLDVIEGRGRVVDEYGKDITGRFVEGAKEALKIARLCRANKAFLKEKSPSCGLAHRGVAAALFLKEGFEVKGFD